MFQHRDGLKYYTTLINLHGQFNGSFGYIYKFVTFN